MRRLLQEAEAGSRSTDRTLWDRASIVEGVALLNGAIGKGRVGEYQLQAAIAAVHDPAAHPDDTDWQQILALYGLLEQMTGDPEAALSHYRAAASRTTNLPEQRYLTAQAARLKLASEAASTNNGEER